MSTKQAYILRVIVLATVMIASWSSQVKGQYGDPESACLSQARIQGLNVNEVISVKSVYNNRGRISSAEVLLDATNRQGTKYRVTCHYNQQTGQAFIPVN